MARRADRAAAARRDNPGMDSPWNSAAEPGIEEVKSLPGATLLEFGTSWCGWCRRAQPHIHSALSAHGGLRHIKVEDGPGQPLGRHYGVKLWPTLVFLRDGAEVARLVRPDAAEPISQALAQICTAA